MSINVPAFLASLLIMVKGMIGIFAVIAIIYLSSSSELLRYIYRQIENASYLSPKGR